jgi:hypothetical protein
LNEIYEQQCQQKDAIEVVLAKSSIIQIINILVLACRFILKIIENVTAIINGKDIEFYNMIIMAYHDDYYYLGNTWRQIISLMINISKIK